MPGLRTDPPRYGAVNLDYIDTWSAIPDERPMWALNLMHYRERADYRDGRETTLSGMAADDQYAPFEPLAAVGARIVLVAPVVAQLAGEDVRWDRIAVVRYPRRRSMLEMEAMPSYLALHEHKEAGMARTIVAATFPRPGSTSAPQPAGGTADDLLLLQLVADPDAPDVATGGCTRLADFDVDGVVIGDGRTWSRARWDAMASGDVDDVRRNAAALPDSHDRYVVVMRPVLNELVT